MICPHCQFEFETAATHCPSCGIRIVRKISGIVKTSSVMIATASENNFYRSVQEVPESLRRRLIETTNSESSGVVVIADRAGRDHWTDIVAHREAQQTPDAAAVASAEIAAPPARAFAGLSWAAWAGILLFLAAGAMVASVFQIFHW
jgi:hypothetical protein